MTTAEVGGVAGHDVDAAAAPGAGWVDVCELAWLIPGRGVTARVAGCTVAVFLLDGGELCAVDDVDPFSGASVLSRGLVGEVDGEPTVASPVYKQRFELRSGRCLDDGDVSVQTWPVRVDGSRVVVGLP